MLEKKVISQFIESLWKHKDDQKADPYIASILEHLDKYVKETNNQAIRDQLDRYKFYKIMRIQGYSEERAITISNLQIASFLNRG